VGARIGDQVGSQLLDEWLEMLRSAKWTFFYMPDQENPAAVAAIYRWRDAVDVFGLFRDRSGLAYRSPMRADGHPSVPCWSPGHSGVTLSGPSVVSSRYRFPAIPPNRYGCRTLRRCVGSWGTLPTVDMWSGRQHEQACAGE
jgi:hypothetical protein